MFNSMVNVTPPGYYAAQSRGVVTGGRLSIRNKVMAPKIVNFDPPRFSATCGGIDLYGGSFSFISKDQLVQYLRSIASNASTYAFSLALTAMCPTCSDEMKNLQKVTQEINNAMKSSCEVGQKLVDSGVDYIKSLTTEKSTQQVVDAGITDRLEASTPPDGVSPANRLNNADPVLMSQIKKNIIWKVLQKHNFSSWFTSGNNTDELMMVVMSITGTIVIGDIPAGADDPEIKTLPSLNIELADLIEGGTIPYYQCDEPVDCLNPVRQDNPAQQIQITGFSQIVSDLLLGTAADVGIISKLRFSQADQLTPAQQSFVETAPGGIIGMLQNIKTQPEVAEQFVRDYADVIGMLMAKDLVSEVVAAVKTLVKSTDSRENYISKEMIDDIEKVNRKYGQQSDRFGKSAEAAARMLANYNELRKTIDLTRYDVLLKRTGGVAE